MVTSKFKITYAACNLFLLKRNILQNKMIQTRESHLIYQSRDGVLSLMRMEKELTYSWSGFFILLTLGQGQWDL